MSPIRSLDSRMPTMSPPLSAAQPTPANPSRRDKIQSLVNEVLPQALSLGLQAAEGLDKAPGSESPSLKTKRGSKRGKVALGTTTIASTLGEALPLASRWAGIAGGILGAADIATNWGRSTPAQGAASGTAVGAAIGTMFTPGIGTAIGAAIGAVAGGLLGSIKTGKHRDQKMRDAVRTFLVDNGILGTDYSIGLADGSRWNIGRDGGPKGDLGGRRPFEVDMSNPMAKYAISWMNPVIALVSQGNQKIQSDFTGYFANAALSNAKTLDDVRANVASIMTQFGVDDESLAKATIASYNAGALDEATARPYLNGIEERRASFEVAAQEQQNAH